jgi:CRP/FNR family transcriptional regulator, cyclic AMP receptor protein
MGSMATNDASDSTARSALRACRLFSELDEPTLDALVGAMRTRRFRRGEIVFHAGDPGDSLFVVTGGGIKIAIPPDDGSEPAILTTIETGGFFGELALLDGQPRSATAQALGPTDTFVLRRDAFDALVDREPALRHALMVALAGEIRRLTVLFQDLHFLDLPGRLANHLLRLAGADPESDASSVVPETEIRLAWRYTQGELAGMIGGSRQSVNRLLADFVAQGLLRFDGDELVIPEPRRLAAAARR